MSAEDLIQLQAVKSIECSCIGCKNACSSKPGWLAPGDAERIAMYVDIPLEVLFKTRLMVDWLEASGSADGEDVFVLSPALVGRPAGEEVVGDSRGACVFLTADRKCSIHKVKPLECRLFSHLERDQYYHKPVGMTWDSPEHQKQIEDLLGRQPEADGWSPSPWSFLSSWDEES